jgi:hypothetical protein
MTTIRDYNVRAVGIPWVRKEDYPAFLAVMEDANGLPATWEAFIKFSEESENGWKAQGYIVERAYIDPDTFPDWCASNGTGIDSNGRMKFAANIANEKHGRNQS